MTARGVSRDTACPCVSSEYYLVLSEGILRTSTSTVTSRIKITAVVGGQLANLVRHPSLVPRRTLPIIFSVQLTLVANGAEQRA